MERSAIRFIKGRCKGAPQESLTYEEVTIHTATADHLPSVRAVLDGVKERAESGKSTIFIHTSGTSVLDDGSLGAFKSDRIYYDNDPASIDAVPDKAPHRQIDLAIVRARKELGDEAKLAIMIPPTIYGFDQKHKRGSIQIPTITRFALKNGYVGHVGKGLSVESQVHFLDLARGYVVLLHHIESSPPSEVLENPYFFCENGKDYSFKEAAEEIGKALHTRGIIDDATPREFKKADYDDLFGEVTPAVIGLNARSRAVRLRALGWEPKEKGIWECFNEDELPEILAEDE